MKILVVGAGIAGLGVVRALRERGIAADVVERQQAWTHDGAGIYLPRERDPVIASSGPDVGRC